MIDEQEVMVIKEVSKCGARPRGGAVSPLMGASCLCEGHFYFDLNMGQEYILLCT
jgi:hypothetical protein